MGTLKEENARLREENIKLRSRIDTVKKGSLEIDKQVKALREIEEAHNRGENTDSLWSEYHQRFPRP